MSATEFLLGIIGLNRIERMTVASVCSLTRSRPRGYSVLPSERSNEADIMLVDADDAEARELWRCSPACRRGRPALMVGRDTEFLAQLPYALPRAHFAGRLVKALDQITIREFKCLPEIVVSDTAGLDGTFGLAAKLPADRSTLPRALVVDDSDVVRTKMRALLGLHGIEADLVADGERAVTRLRMQNYAIVFLDVMLPGMDGYQTCRLLKAEPNPPPIIMLTGRDSPFDKIRGVMAGCSRYLTKPIAVDALNKVLQEFLPGERRLVGNGLAG
jgi:two-component system, cell cycle response regulator